MSDQEWGYDYDGSDGVETDTTKAETDGEKEASSDNDGQAAEPEAPTLFYGSVDEWIREWLCRMYARQINGRTRYWAGRWWKFPEACGRLEAMWRAWEQMRLDPATGIAVWYRDYADHHMNVLMSPEGPFASLDDPRAPENMNTDVKGRGLPYVRPPKGMFPDVRQ